MRRVVLYFWGVIFLCFFLPAVLTNEFVEVSAGAEEEIDEKYNYGEFNTVKLLHTSTNTLEEMPLEEYLYGVVSAEMPASYEVEALKAQAIVARTYTVYKANNSKHENATICDNSNCCQAWISKDNRLARWDYEKKDEYWNKIVSSVDSTKGKIITYEGKPINAFFHSNSGGTTEAPIDVWGGSSYPYLQSVETSGEDAYSQYSSEVSFTKEEVLEKIRQNHKEAQIDFDSEDAIQVKDYTDGGRVKTISFGNVNLSGVEARTLFGLKSANFKVSFEGEIVKFSVIGYGHGVGMSQTGADSLAKQGKTYEDIIHHFYTDVEITEL